MLKEIKLHDKIIEYDLQRKNVKNINLRIKQDGTIYVSANKWVSEETIEKFILSKADFILRALSKYKEEKEVTIKQYYSEDMYIDMFCDFYHLIIPFFTIFI